MSLTDIIIEKIQKEGPISFHDFMEMALYYPALGYYTSNNDQIGKKGDYYTSPYLTKIFGQLLAKQIEEYWEFQQRQPLTIVEFGAGPGLLSFDILGQLKKNKILYDQLTYCIIEKSEAMRDREKLILTEKVTWKESITEIDLSNACILSNEVVDNFSVHIVEMQEELMEVFVDFEKYFREIYRPAAPRLKNYLQELQVILPKGYRTEINLQAVKWITEISRALSKGIVLTIDYGYPASEFFHPQRSSGSLIAYHKHKVSNQLYEKIGEQDITAHVNFSALALWGAKYGLENAGFASQTQFLLGLGMTEHLRKMEEQAAKEQIGAKEKALMIHTFLMDIGNKIKIMVQYKGLKDLTLSGLTFSKRFI